MFQIISKIQLFPFWQDTQETMWFQQRTQASREDAEYMAPEQNAEVWVTVQSSRKFWNYGNILSHPCSCFKHSSHHHKKIRFISSFHIFSFSHHHSQPSIPGAAASASSSIFLAFSTAWSASCSCSCAVTWWKLFMRQKSMYIYIYVCVKFVCICMYVCMHACMDVCMYGWMDGWMYVCMYVCVCMCVCVYVCMYAYTCILYIYIHTYKQVIMLAVIVSMMIKIMIILCIYIYTYICSFIYLFIWKFIYVIYQKTNPPRRHSRSFPFQLLRSLSLGFRFLQLCLEHRVGSGSELRLSDQQIDDRLMRIWHMCLEYGI